MARPWTRRPFKRRSNVCSRNGGGTVVFPSPGRYLIGTIRIKDDVTLQVPGRAVILGSKELANYSPDTGHCSYANEALDRCLIYAKNARNIGLTGKGTICGNYARMVSAPAARTLRSGSVPCSSASRTAKKSMSTS